MRCQLGPDDLPDWFIRMTRPAIDLDAAIGENRAPHEGRDALILLDANNMF